MAAPELETLLAAGMAAFGGYVTWRRGMKVNSLRRGTATSKIATAAKGFVELQGVARPFRGRSVADPITYSTCLWHFFQTEELVRSGKRETWRVVESGESVEPFVIQDATGACTVKVTRANVDAVDSDTVDETSSRRHKVWRIFNGDPLYALGHLDRLGSNAVEAPEQKPVTTSYAQRKQVHEHATKLLSFWKLDRARMNERFDTNKDGHVDWHELERAQATARQLAEQHVAANAPQVPAEAVVTAQPQDAEPEIEVTHRLRKPDDHRPLVVAKGFEAQLTARTRSHALVGLIFFVVGTVALVWMLRDRFG